MIRIMKVAIIAEKAGYVFFCYVTTFTRNFMSSALLNARLRFILVVFFNHALIRSQFINNTKNAYICLPKQKDIWTPDVVLKNGITTFEELGGEFYYLQVTSDGRVTWLPF